MLPDAITITAGLTAAVALALSFATWVAARRRHYRRLNSAAAALVVACMALIGGVGMTPYFVPWIFA